MLFLIAVVCWNRKFDGLFNKRFTCEVVKQIGTPPEKVPIEMVGLIGNYNMHCPWWAMMDKSIQRWVMMDVTTLKIRGYSIIRLSRSSKKISRYRSILPFNAWVTLLNFFGLKPSQPQQNKSYILKLHLFEEKNRTTKKSNRQKWRGPIATKIIVAVYMFETGSEWIQYWTWRALQKVRIKYG